jgi:acetoin utilization deacetylase AcuC-like enzyme
MLRVAWKENYVLPVPANHRFPMSKYEVLPEQLIHEGTIGEGNLFAPEFVDERWILGVHDESYWQRLKNLALSPKEVRRTGFTMSQALVDREVTIVQGTLACTAYALQYGIAMNIAGGTHHAFTNRGEGFCLLNDIAVAAHYLLEMNEARKILVVDLDVHQGNGTAEIFKNEPRVFTFSMHGAHNYPLVKETSDRDVGLPDGAGDRLYLSTLDRELKTLVDKVEPDFIFYQSGVDILETDALGRLGVSREGCRKRDSMVFRVAKASGIPVVASMGGGYSRVFRDIIEAHANTFREAQYVFF